VSGAGHRRPIRLAVIGLGKMGRAVEALAPERGFVVVSRIGGRDNIAGSGITPGTLGGAEVAIEFTEPESAPTNIEACMEAGVPVVCGTTGWYDQLRVVAASVERYDGALLHAPNFSLGVAVFLKAVRAAAAAARGAGGFDAHVVEIHHAAKKDAPSGTAAVVQRTAAESLGRDVPVTSVRTGSVPGTHTLILDGAFEQIRVEHEARDRRVFADGALTAARWLVGRRGVFTMDDVLADATAAGAEESA
jgi:4-hydroxy-tetrahydrodipicolinate reductase